MDEAVLTEAAGFLAGLDSDWAELITKVGPCMLKTHTEREPYEALVRAIAYQQLHSRAAEAILGRMLMLFPDGRFPDPEALLSLEDSALRGCGFSASKITAIRGIASAARDSLVPTSYEAASLSDEALIERLVQLRGVGRWTVEMLLIFTLGRADVLPVDDFGVREGWRVLKQLDEQPKPKALAQIGEAWRPYRSIAAWYLWRSAELAKASAPPKIPKL
ncbi:DNA-3-methyladenine glycosylase II [Novimethylophilus kurashikiensis]|uniref:DNA-3-methyladenine glycosylase II n=1 Tax=Novimethylophilus kurashikiensis TaxID=1825523 RepID=A0A2R5FB89_9PROT|nr:DNA-3-methyladenine glycosylase [Novimethylophilus kurashikiensis]GBG15496.1 DNA-3-methyladenine glycosylase II [Novimethylophilus kurashikiensis]